MSRVVSDAERTIVDTDPARVWTLVADLNRLGDWFPIRVSGSMTTEVPTVGHTFFVTYRPGPEGGEPIRLRIAEWEAGHRYRCEVIGVGVMTDATFEVSVLGVPHGDSIDTQVRLRFRGEVTRWIAPLVRAEMNRRFRVALDRLTAEVR